MCQAIDDLIEDGRAEGRAEERISIIGSMVKKLCCTLEEACEVAGISVQEYQQAVGRQA